ncbi:lipopolysaccharide assembly protein LapB [Thalassobacillus sp. CUG 92003]|uniref:tetratricopeptide repeat protein n=1 Tax=Thalassobacillus sp. CUG 92003 TaxID=2736641 RepID=UPI0015E78FB9|nr:tetratricopeptide repeat protein [Thalassobacillus sp. CUG 92003]
MEEIQKAVSLMEENNTQQALETLQTYLPEADEEEKFTIAELYIQWGMLEEAKMILLELTQRYPQEAEIKVMLADIHIDLEEDEEAINLLNQFNPEDEEYVQSLMQLADLYQSQGLYEVAEQKLLLAKQVEPNEAIIDFALGELAFSNGEYNKSIPFYENAMEHQPVIAEVEVASRMAEAYAATGEFELALEMFSRVEEEHPDIQFRHGVVAFQANRNDIAIKVWENVLNKDPYYVSVYPQLAHAYEENGMLQEAFDMAKKGLDKDEYNKELYHLAGSLAHKLEETEQSYRYMREAIALDPGYKEAILFLTERFKAEDDYESVSELIEELLKLGEEDPNYFWELAHAKEKQEMYGEALEYYNQAYISFKEDSDFLKEFGYFLVEEGHMAQAKKMLQEYLVIEPSDHEVEEFVSRLTDDGTE